MGDMGPIEIGEDGFNVGSNGVIYDNEGGELDLFSIVDADNYNNLTVYDNGCSGPGRRSLRRVILRFTRAGWSSPT